MSCNGPGALIRSTGSRGGSECAETALDGRSHIQVPPPALDEDLGLTQAVEDLAVQQLVAHVGVDAGTPRRTNRSESTSMTSAVPSLRSTRMARHSWVNSSMTFNSLN